MSKPKPNIVFFFTDDQRFDTVNALGNKQISTPNIDELVNNGTSFTNAHIAGGTEPAVCMPSRAMLHTGKSLFNLTKNGMLIPENDLLMGEHLRANGYRTFGTGKWHNGTTAYHRSFTDGGEIFFGGMWDHWNIPACDYDPTGQYNKTHKWNLNPMFSKHPFEIKADHLTLGKHSTELFADKSIDFINNYQDTAPFFMYISFMAPHDPRSMPEAYLDLYDPKSIELPKNFKPEHDFDYGVSKLRDEVLAPYPRTVEDTKQQIAEYYAMISHLDHEVGRVIKALKAKGTYQNTVFIFAGDNGLAVGQHGLFGKQNVYEHSIKVPLIFMGPNLPKGETRDDEVYLFDIFPTLCDYLGLEKPASIDGKSLYRSINGEETLIRDGMYFAYADLVRGVKNNGFKFIEYNCPDGTRRHQLFNLNDDPDELVDLSANPKYTDKKTLMRKKLLALRDEWNDRHHEKGELFWANT